MGYLISLGPKRTMGTILATTERYGKEQIRKCRCNPTSVGVSQHLSCTQDQCELPPTPGHTHTRIRGIQGLPRNFCRSLRAGASGGSGPCLCGLSPTTPWLPTHGTSPFHRTSSPTPAGVEVVGGEARKVQSSHLNRTHSGLLVPAVTSW